MRRTASALRCVSFMVVTENYPDIKSGQNFLPSRNQIEGTENRIAIARRDYIQAVKQYNTRTRHHPGRWWASFLYPTAKEMATFDIPADEMQVPKVDFGTRSNSCRGHVCCSPDETGRIFTSPRHGEAMLRMDGDHAPCHAPHGRGEVMCAMTRV